MGIMGDGEGVKGIKGTLTLIGFWQMYRIVETLYCTLGINITLYANYTSISIIVQFKKENNNLKMPSSLISQTFNSFAVWSFGQIGFLVVVPYSRNMLSLK